MHQNIKTVTKRQGPYKFPEKINTTNFFRMYKALIMSGHWSGPPLASKRIYPVIGVHTNTKGWAFPSQETIGIITGCTEKTVREGVDGLKGFPGFQIDNFVTTRGKRAKSYNIKPPPEGKGESIRLYKAFFEGGYWCQLPSVAQAVYPVLVAFSYFDFEIYFSIMEEVHNTIIEPDINDFFTSGDYGKRWFDVADPELDILAEHAGVSMKSLYKALDDLEETGFIQKYNMVFGTYFGVFILPPPVHHLFEPEM